MHFVPGSQPGQLKVAAASDEVDEHEDELNFVREPKKSKRQLKRLFAAVKDMTRPREIILNERKAE